jgi:hypothetical protein
MTDDELMAIPPVEIEPGHIANPFKDRIGTPEGWALALRWGQLHWPDSYQEPREPTPTEALMEEVALDRNGWTRTDSPFGKAAYFPAPAKDPDSWERRAVEMAAAQVTLDVESKVSENVFAKRTRRVAELIDPLFEAPPEPYHLSAESRIARGVGTPKDRETVKPAADADPTAAHPLARFRRGD